MKCGDCRHWERYSDPETAEAVGECMAIGENEGRATIIGEGIGLGLVTDFDFGCVLFEPR